MNKKSYYFIVDALIAVMILAVGFMLISSFYINKPEKIMIKNAADDIINLLATTKLYDLCNVYGDCSDEVLQEIFTSIKNKDNTLLEVIGELIRTHNEETNNKDKASRIIESIIVANNMIPPGYNLTFFIEEGEKQVLVYPRGNIPAPIMQKSKALVTTKKVIFSYFGEPVIYWGPYIAEAQILRLESYITCETDTDCIGMKCHPEHKICVDKICYGGEFCFSDSACCGGYEYYCNKFQCTPKITEFSQFCINEAGCGPGYYCYKMECVYTPGDINDPCGYNDDCNKGLICENRRCGPSESNEGDDCSATGKCGIGMYCLNGKCVYSNTGTPGAGGDIGSGCDSDTDCEQGKICVNGNCEEGTYNEGDDCESNEECGPGLVCNIDKCEPAGCKQGDSCGSDNDCGIGLVCEGDIVKTCEPGTNGLGEECDEQSDCGDGLICDMTLTPPECIVTLDGAGADCYNDSDCSCGFYCDNFKCTNGKSGQGDSCTIQEDCGAGLVCVDNVCQSTEGNPCDLCYSFSDCNKFIDDIALTVCIDGTCYLGDNLNGDCSSLGACLCGPGLFCFFADQTCQETGGMEGDPCNTDTECKAGLKCVDNTCTFTAGVNDTGICGDGSIDGKTEQCEGGSTICTHPDLNCEGTATVYCNSPGTNDECRWDKTVCDNCPVCDFPADCRENCAISPGEVIWLFNYWQDNSEPYYCGGREPEDLVTPTSKMTQCSLALYSIIDYNTNWPNVVVGGRTCSGIPRQ